MKGSLGSQAPAPRVNYLAHALHALDAPWIVAGTSLPDWLRVVDRRARLRAPALRALKLPPGPAALLRQGVLRHHEDDARFHAAPLFEALSHDAVRAIRALSPDPRLRASALGHIVVEMLLDAAIEAERPGAMDAYYRAVGALDGTHLTELVEGWTGRPQPHLPLLLQRFQRARFLFAYLTDDGLVNALGGVCARAGLSPPPAGTVHVVGALRPRIREAARSLVP